MITLRLAEPLDFEFFFALKSEPSNIFWTGHSSPPDRVGLKAFFDDILAKHYNDTTRKCYIIENDGVSVGCVYLDPSQDHLREFDFAVAISEKYQGRGYAKEAIALGLDFCKKMGMTKLVGKIREDNTASLRAYTACGIIVKDEYELVFVPGLNREVKMFRVEKEL